VSHHHATRLILGILALSAAPGFAALRAAQTPTPPATERPFWSGKGDAQSIGRLKAVVAWARRQTTHRPEDSVVLATGATLARPHFVPCADKPFAVVFDSDDLMIWNLGQRSIAGEKPDPVRWEQWRKAGAAEAVPGAVDAIGDLRAMGVKVIFIDNEQAKDADAVAARIKAAGLGDVESGQTLLLKETPTEEKDRRRALVAAQYCVIALAGVHLGDYSDQLNTHFSASGQATRTAGAAVVKLQDGSGPPPPQGTARLFGRGWFGLPNPISVYAASLHGGVDTIFAPNKR
jgi:predicted secreted acid phosphatase